MENIVTSEIGIFVILLRENNASHSRFVNFLSCSDLGNAQMQLFLKIFYILTL